MAKWVLNNEDFKLYCGSCGAERDDNKDICNCKLKPKRIIDEGMQTLTAHHPNGAKASIDVWSIRIEDK